MPALARGARRQRRRRRLPRYATRDIPGAWRLRRGGLPIAHSDIDLALKLRSSGLKVLYTPHITLRHFEAKTRGLDHLDPEKAARNRAERRLLTERWGAALTAE